MAECPAQTESLPHHARLLFLRLVEAEPHSRREENVVAFAAGQRIRLITIVHAEIQLEEFVDGHAGRRVEIQAELPGVRHIRIELQALDEVEPGQELHRELLVGEDLGRVAVFAGGVYLVVVHRAAAEVEVPARAMSGVKAQPAAEDAAQIDPIQALLGSGSPVSDTPQ